LDMALGDYLQTCEAGCHPEHSEGSRGVAGISAGFFTSFR